MSDAVETKPVEAVAPVTDAPAEAAPASVVEAPKVVRPVNIVVVIALLSL